MSLHEKHIAKVEAVNDAQTLIDHDSRYWELQGWRTGVTDCGRTLDLLGCDSFYLDQGIDRPMCCGVWLDWKPADEQAEQVCGPSECREEADV